MIDLWVSGRSGPQGSKAYKGHRASKQTGRSVPILVESCKSVGPWRQHVAVVAGECWAGRPLLTGELAARLGFVLQRPTTAPKTARLTAARRVGDLDKLCRAVFDALTGVVIEDDCLIVELTATKRIAHHGEEPGCAITVWALPSEQPEEINDSGIRPCDGAVEARPVPARKDLRPTARGKRAVPIRMHPL